VHAGFVRELLLAPSSRFPQFTNAIPESLAKEAQFIPEWLDFSLRFAHSRESEK
jgi:hypothetical protein